MSTGSAPIPIDISSDEDDLTDWIDELLDGKEDLEDIVLMDEFLNSVEIPEEEEEEEERSRRMGDSDDDDCLVLDFDPDKPVEVKVDDGDGDGSDDLVVVGDKGEIACRDFPHSRHLCASYPFSTTFHEKHCSLCHCYVCDSLAPCVYWGNGASFMDHCNATDKDEMWKNQRKSFKATNTVTLPRERPDDATLRMISPPIRNSAPIQRPVSVSRPTQPSTLNPLRSCSASSVATPYALGQKHHQRPPVISRHGQNLSQQSSRSLPSTAGRQCVQKERHGAGAHSILQSSHSIFKRTGTPGSGLRSSSINCPRFKPSDVNQRPMPQKPHYPRPVQVLRPFPQAVTSHSTRVTLVTPQLSQQATITSQRSHPLSTPQRMSVTSQGSHPSSTPQRMPVTSQRSQLSSTRQIPPSVPVPSRTTQLAPVVHLEDSVKKLQGIPSSVASDFVPSQEMGYHHRGPLTTSPDPVDLVCSWLDRTAGDNFTEAGEPVVQPSEPVVPLWITAPEFSSIESLVSSAQQEAVQLLEDSVKNLQGILGSVASEFDVSGSVLTSIQPYLASSQCPSVGNQIPSQEMGYHHPGPSTTSPDPVDLVGQDGW